LPDVLYELLEAPLSKYLIRAVDQSFLLFPLLAKAFTPNFKFLKKSLIGRSLPASRGKHHILAYKLNNLGSPSHRVKPLNRCMIRDLGGP
jgi:hypothetical protein